MNEVSQCGCGEPIEKVNDFWVHADRSLDSHHTAAEQLPLFTHNKKEDRH